MADRQSLRGGSLLKDRSKPIPRTSRQRQWLPVVDGSIRDTSYSWISATVVGIVLTFVLFALLGWLRPDLEGVEKNSNPRDINLAFFVAPDSSRIQSGYLAELSPPEDAATPESGENQKQISDKASLETIASDDFPGLAFFQSELGAGIGENGNGLQNRLNSGTSLTRNFDSQNAFENRERSSSGATKGLKFLRRTRVMESSKLKEPVSVAPPPRRVVVPPRPIFRPNPGYPKQAQNGEKEGFVRVKILVSPKGDVTEYEILESVPPGIFDKSVNEVISLWKFSPALDDFDKPIKCYKWYKFDFYLEEARR